MVRLAALVCAAPHAALLARRDDGSYAVLASTGTAPSAGAAQVEVPLAPVAGLPGAALVVTTPAPPELSGPALELLAVQAHQLLCERRAAAASAVLREVLAAAASARTPAEALECALGAVCTFAGWPAGTAYLVDQGSGDDRAVASWASGEPAAGPLRSVPVLEGGTQVGRLELSTGAATPPDAELDGLLAQVGVALGRVVERQRAAAELAHREERLRRMVDSAGVAFFSADAAGRITAWNVPAQELFGWPVDQALGSALADVLLLPGLAADGVQGWLASRTSVPADEPVIAAARHRDGSPTPVEMVAWATGEGPRVELNAFVRDITHRHEVERLVQADLERKERLVEELRGVDRFANDVVTTVSHEFRTPLTSMLGYLELLCDDSSALAPLHQEALSAVHRNSHRLKRLVDNLVTVSRLDAGEAARVSTDVDLSATVAELVEEQAAAALAKGVLLSAHVDPHVGVEGDNDLLDRLVSNLVGNGLKFTPAGGSVRVSLRREGAWALLQVRDTGIGIALEEQEAVFQRFYRAADAEARAIQGSGIGLAIVREVAAAHEGSVTLVSQPGAGTTVTVRLPLVPAMAGTAAEQ
ncbi:PAS domain S-box-containing protein [Motilibacter peucedani]|uniref:histidine kinase n=1 Tax=Motilibacter peucedani TaxID=598650 RepID=A0A420XUG7_9ACTN|nr:ATP-binding protein [Motilibacter peucedani]RKS80474.1 PAS domain S-box-containing protein [Motilibacter peucedani]